MKKFTKKITALTVLLCAAQPQVQSDERFFNTIFTGLCTFGGATVGYYKKRSLRATLLWGALSWTGAKISSKLASMAINTVVSALTPNFSHPKLKLVPYNNDSQKLTQEQKNCREILENLFLTKEQGHYKTPDKAAEKQNIDFETKIKHFVHGYKKFVCIYHPTENEETMNTVITIGNNDIDLELKNMLDMPLLTFVAVKSAYAEKREHAENACECLTNLLKSPNIKDKIKKEALKRVYKTLQQLRFYPAGQKTLHSDLLNTITMKLLKAGVSPGEALADYKEVYYDYNDSDHCIPHYKLAKNLEKEIGGNAYQTNPLYVSSLLENYCAALESGAITCDVHLKEPDFAERTIVQNKYDYTLQTQESGGQSKKVTKYTVDWIQKALQNNEENSTQNITLAVNLANAIEHPSDTNDRIKISYYTFRKIDQHIKNTIDECVKNLSSTPQKKSENNCTYNITHNMPCDWLGKKFKYQLRIKHNIKQLKSENSTIQQSENSTIQELPVEILRKIRAYCW